MSTFKRLFNVGMGKAKVASKGVSEAVSGVGDVAPSGDWVDSVRHTAADAAETVAEVIRPAERVARAETASGARAETAKPAALERNRICAEPSVPAARMTISACSTVCGSASVPEREHTDTCHAASFRATLKTSTPQNMRAP